MNKRIKPAPQRGASLLIFMGAVLVVAAILAFGLTHKRWEGQGPEIAVTPRSKFLGRNPSLGVTVRDAGTGLKHVAIHFKQKDQDVVVVDEALNHETAKTYDVGKLIGEKY